MLFRKEYYIDSWKNCSQCQYPNWFLHTHHFAEKQPPGRSDQYSGINLEWPRYGRYPTRFPLQQQLYYSYIDLSIRDGEPDSWYRHHMLTDYPGEPFLSRYKQVLHCH